jgi:hypothetical protein
MALLMDITNEDDDDVEQVAGTSSFIVKDRNQ